ncbi:MAG: hypothetical protein P4L77_10660 [Sulfuriferula sp.]|nr:hypothetical protein [Sulfuriferula sp.]
MKQSLNTESLSSLILQGDHIPDIAYGEIFHVVPTRNNKKILAVSTRFGPVVFARVNSREISIIMNATLEPYIHRMCHQQMEGPLSNASILSLWLGHTIHNTYGGNRVWLNIGQMVEKDFPNENE